MKMMTRLWCHNSSLDLMKNTDAFVVIVRFDLRFKAIADALQAEIMNLLPQMVRDKIISNQTLAVRAAALRKKAKAQ